MIGLLVHTCSISRRQKIAGKGLASAWQSVGDGVRCLILPSTQEDALHENVEIGKDYNAYFEIGTDIKEGDKITSTIDGAEITLLIKGIARYGGVPSVSHIECSCETAGDN